MCIRMRILADEDVESSYFCEEVVCVEERARGEKRGDGH